MRLTALALAAAVAVPVVAAPALAATDTGTQRRFVVQFAAGTAPSSGAAEVRSRGGQVERELRHVFSGAVVRMSAQAASALSRSPRVATVEADAAVRATSTQSGAPWGLDRVDQRALPLSTTYEHTRTGRGVTAYVVDTGIRADHVDLQGRVGAGWTAISDEHGTGDCQGHGTHVAGTIGGTTHGIAKAVTLVPVRVLDCSGAGSLSGVVSGLDWVVGHHAAGAPAVANLSLGGGASTTLDNAVSATIADGVSVVVAAGNSGVDACTGSPARVAGAVTVGATDRYDARASFSNWGTCLDLFAPGVGVLSAHHTSSTATASMSGTSMAAPHAAGAAAAVLELEPTLSPSAVADRLSTATTTGVVTGSGTGSPNRLLWSDPAATTTPVTSEPVAATAPSAPTSVKAVAGRRSATVSWTRGSDGGSALTGQTVRVHRGTSLAGTVSVSATTTTVKVSGLVAGASYTFSVTATNAVGTSPESARSTAVIPSR